jgi:hypothetical protein
MAEFSGAGPRARARLIVQRGDHRGQRVRLEGVFKSCISWLTRAALVEQRSGPSSLPIMMHDDCRLEEKHYYFGSSQYSHLFCGSPVIQVLQPSTGPPSAEQTPVVWEFGVVTTFVSGVCNTAPESHVHAWKHAIFMNVKGPFLIHVPGLCCCAKAGMDNPIEIMPAPIPNIRMTDIAVAPF